MTLKGEIEYINNEAMSGNNTTEFYTSELLRLHQEFVDELKRRLREIETTPDTAEKPDDFESKCEYLYFWIYDEVME